MALLVFTPTYGDGPDARTLASVAAQEGAPAFHHHVNWLEKPLPGRNPENVLNHYRQGQAMCLAGDYEAMVTVEHDMILPPDALSKLYATDAPVVYAVYLLRHGTITLSAWRYVDNRKMGPTLSLYPEELETYRARGWAKVSGVGWGCTLIRREVLRRVTIHGHDGGDAGDVGLAADCLINGILQIARFDVLCGHITESGTVLMPFEDGGILGRVLALKNAPTGFKGIEKPMVRGSYYSVPIEMAHELRRAGYVRITNLDKATPCLS